MSNRPGDFPYSIKFLAYERQGGRCAFCGVKLMPPQAGGSLGRGKYFGEAHHLKPLKHGGRSDIDNCVYLCYADHKLHGHGMAPFGIDKQGGSSSTWVKLKADDFAYWNYASRTK